MAASDTTKYHRLLRKISQDEELKSMDPKDFCHFLRIHDVLTDDELERLVRSETRTERQLLFVRITWTKTPARVVKWLYKFSIDSDISRLKTLIKEEYGVDFSSIENFGNDSFHCAVQYLKDVYLTSCEVMKKEWRNLCQYPEEFDMDQMYVDLEIRKCARRSNEALKDYPEMFGCENGKRKFRKIVVIGDAGIGKTTYVHKLAQDWAHGDEWLNDQFDLVICARLGAMNPNANSFKDLLPSMPASVQDRLVEYAFLPQNHSRVLIVLDAFEEIPLLSCNCPPAHIREMDLPLDNFNVILVLDGLDEIAEQIDLPDIFLREASVYHSLIERHIFGETPVPNWTLLVTARISHSEFNALQNNMDFLLRVNGLSENSAKKALLNTPNYNGNTKTAIELCRNPSVMGMALAGRHNTQELFDLVSQFGLHMFRRFLAKTKTDFITSWKTIRTFLSKYAFLKIAKQLMSEASLFKVESEQMFSSLQESLKKNIYGNTETLEVCKNAGYLWEVENCGLCKKKNRSTSCFKARFLHPLLQEYYAAVFIAENEANLTNVLSLNDSPIIDQMFVSSSLSYFLSALYPPWKAHLLRKCVSLHSRALCIPWVYDPTKCVGQIPFGDYKPIQSIGHPLQQSEFPSNGGLFLKELSFQNPNVFSQVRQLVKVSIDQNSAEILRHIGGEKIEFVECSVEETSADALNNLLLSKPLKAIRIDGFDVNFCESVLRSIPNLKLLTALKIKYLEKRHDKTWNTLTKMLEQKKNGDLKQLEKLSLVNCSFGIAESSIFTVLPSCLRKLKLDHCTLNGSTCKNMAKFLQCATSLEELSLNLFRNIDYTIIIESLPRTLVMLSVSECQNCSQYKKSIRAMMDFLGNSSRIKVLCIEGNEAMGETPDFAEALVYSSSLETVELVMCNLKTEFLETLITMLLQEGRQFEKVCITETSSADVFRVKEKLMEQFSFVCVQRI